MKYKDIVTFLKDQEAKPEQTNRFIQKYQQTNSGNGTYIHEAILQGMMIYKSEGEPNQRWHFINAWYDNKVKNDSNFEDKEVCNWCKLRCPELLLWIAEVCGQQDKVKELVDEIIENDNVYHKNDTIARNKMVAKIKEKIKWDDIIQFIENN